MYSIVYFILCSCIFLGSDAARKRNYSGDDARRGSSASAPLSPLGVVRSQALPVPVAATGSTSSMGQTVLTLRQVPIEVMASSSALLPQPSFRESVHVTQLTLERVSSDSELDPIQSSGEPVSSLSPEWPTSDLHARARSYSARDERLRRGTRFRIMRVMVFDILVLERYQLRIVNFIFRLLQILREES